jgi:uncharacterized membrane protein YfcA
MLLSAHQVLADGLLHSGGEPIKIIVAGFLVGIVVGITGMGGGALMTPALIFLGVGGASTVVTADLTASAVYKSGGALVHWRHGAPNLKLAGWLMLGSVPMALIGPHVVPLIVGSSSVDVVDAYLQMAIGFALLLAASTFALRLYVQLRRVRRGAPPTGEPVLRPIPTVAIGALGGLLVGITSVGSGSVIMIALVILYPMLSAVKLVGTDLVQAVPLVLAAAIANIATYGLDLGLTIPLIIGSVPGALLGARIAPKVPSSLIRRGLVVVLVMSGLALLDKSGWAPLGAGDDQTHPILIALVGLALVVAVPFAWGLIRRTEGLPMFGTPTVQELETPYGSNTPAVDREPSPPAQEPAEPTP